MLVCLMETNENNSKWGGECHYFSRVSLYFCLLLSMEQRPFVLSVWHFEEIIPGSWATTSGNFIPKGLLTKDVLKKCFATGDLSR